MLIASPRIDVAVGGYAHGYVCTGADRGELQICGDWAWLVGGVGIAGIAPQYTVVVAKGVGFFIAAPGPGGAVGGQGHGIPVAGADRGEGGSLGHGHFRRGDVVHGTVVGRAAELAVLVLPPGPDVAVPVQGHGMDVAGADGDELNIWRGGGKTRRGIAVTHSHGSAPQTSGFVVSPGPDSAVPVQGHGIPATIGDMGELHAIRHLDHHRGGSTRRGAFHSAGAQLAAVVSSPCIGVPVAAQCQGMKLSRGHLGEGDAVRRVDAHIVATGPGTRRGVDRPLVIAECPPGGQRCGPLDGSAEVVGDISLEPAVKCPTRLAWIVRALDGVTYGDLLVGYWVAVLRLESDGGRSAGVGESLAGVVGLACTCGVSGLDGEGDGAQMVPGGGNVPSVGAFGDAADVVAVAEKNGGYPPVG